MCFGIATEDRKMKCPKCHKEISDNAEICSECGERIVSFETKATPITPVISLTPTPAPSIIENNEEKTSKGKYMVAGGADLAALICMICIIRLMPKETSSSNSDMPTELETVPISNSVKNEIPTDLFSVPDELLETGKSQITKDTELVDGINNLAEAMHQFAKEAEEAGDVSLASERIEDAYDIYSSAVIQHKAFLEKQALSGAIYSQILLELDEAISLGNDLAEKGYAVNMSLLKDSRSDFETSYADKVITTFDEFTTRETWSRTEAWNLMSATADNMFDTSDLDNPIRLRYAYALSWWTQKQIETELSYGTITLKGAAIKIANMIDIMDYNPMMIQYYITYMNAVGEDCTEVSNAYNEIVEHIARSQGIRIGTDIDLPHFWYFNDFVNHPVDDVNGVTQENRQWIRGRMGYVTFIKK